MTTTKQFIPGQRVQWDRGGFEKGATAQGTYLRPAIVSRAHIVKLDDGRNVLVNERSLAVAVDVEYTHGGKTTCTTLQARDYAKDDR